MCYEKTKTQFNNNELSKMGVKINYITDGDIAGVLSVIGNNPKNDIYYSTGGGPEGVLVHAYLVTEDNSRQIGLE